uniref:Neuropeptide Y prohormone-4 n=1 Tax=Schmidtea mediterranea TaxID=79327 RepID=E3CTL4_SCHMD|nr:TPA_inf: neuropeptide Y prohormone-4 [Schmidtea mediterranea]
MKFCCAPRLSVLFLAVFIFGISLTAKEVKRKVVYLKSRNHFRSDEDYVSYLRKVQKYIQLYGRPRFGKRQTNWYDMKNYEGNENYDSYTF